MNRKALYCAVALLLAPLSPLSPLCGSAQAAGPAPGKPNIVFVVADDMGFSDPGCYGGDIATPNLDHLAAQGLRFTQFYNTARCWPSRASILTGYYAQAVRRDALSDVKLLPGEPVGGYSGTRPRWAQLLPEYLKPVGYRCYMSGKWHLDGEPLKNGFDHAYVDSNELGYFAEDNHREDGVKLPAIPPDGKWYSTVAIADHAIKYLKDHAATHADQPFFEYVAFHSPHFPIQALPEDIALYADTYKPGWDVMRERRLERMKKLGILDCALSPLDPITLPSYNLSEEQLHAQIGPDEIGHAVPWNTLNDGQKAFQATKMAIHAAMVHRMDLEIGRVLEQLKAMGAYDNTVIFFMSDNGASAEMMIRGLGEDPKVPMGSATSHLCIGPAWASLANTPLRLYKMWNEEGGVSTPLIVHWPAGISAHGELRNNPGHLVDLTPTVLELTGASQPKEVAELPVPPLQGKSLVPAFYKDNSVPHEFIWFDHMGNRAIRMGDWKLVADKDGPWELFNLATDRSEVKNLAAEHPEKVKALSDAWQKHADEFHTLALQDPPQRNKAKKNAAGKIPATQNAKDASAEKHDE